MGGCQSKHSRNLRLLSTLFALYPAAGIFPCTPRYHRAFSPLPRESDYVLVVIELYKLVQLEAK